MTAPATGRAGRLRLRSRLAVAHRAAGLLDRKRQILSAELAHLRMREQEAATDWASLAAEAARWFGRTAALDGQRALAMATPPDDVAVSWTESRAVGVEFPVDPVCVLPGGPTTPAGSSLAYAILAHRRALVAAVSLAVARRAVQRVEAELAATRVRHRAIEDRWIPRLEAELRQLDLALDELDREENLRARRVLDT